LRYRVKDVYLNGIEKEYYHKIIKNKITKKLKDMENQEENKPTEIIIKNENKSNGMGVAGFILALLGLCLSWAPVAGWIIWFLGALFSIIGLFKKPRGFAIAGFIISFIDLIILIFVVTALAAIL
jgi:hypothetical protein